ncbi:MAG: gliding motility protein GldN [Bacteroidota bacterium]
MIKLLKKLICMLLLCGVWFVRPAFAQQPIPPPSLREADVMFSKRMWRVIDLREKQNKKITWPGNPIVKILYESVRTGQLKPYRSDSLRSYYNIEAFMRLGEEVEFVETPTDPNDPSITKVDTIYTPFDPEQRIKQLILMEDWFFDKKTSTMSPRIIAIAPLYRVKVGGIDLGLQPLCWLRFDDRLNKEKDCRDILVSQFVFNPENSRSRFSYDDWFAQRLFGSYVIKTANMYDVSILQDPYYKKNGLEALIESERLKQQQSEREENDFQD